MDSIEWLLHELQFKIDELWYTWIYGYWRQTTAGQVLLGYWPVLIAFVALSVLVVRRRLHR